MYIISNQDPDPAEELVSEWFPNASPGRRAILLDALHRLLEERALKLEQEHYLYGDEATLP